ncbi:MAG: ATP-binding protein [Candidatus Protistobacter heckmanni]|nr:ATP-binding protein [Candidatus Protistobacter heckmanni]
MTVDVTEIQEADQQAARVAAEDANKAKDAFLATMSHEIRTLLNAIIGFARLTEESADEGEHKENARHIREMGEMLRNILNDIFDFSKIDANKLHLEMQPMSIPEVLELTRTVFSAQAQSKGLDFEMVCAPDLPPVIGDSLRLRQIVHNLLSNAIKFTSEDKVSLLVGAAPQADGRLLVRFDVIDTGIGTEAKTKLFLRFSQAESSTARRFGGTGLGLAIYRSLAELMHGTTHLQSTPSKGSTFTSEIPFHVAAQELESAAALPRKAREGAEPLRVIVVDDVPLNRKLLGKVLRKTGHEVFLAEGGVQAREVSIIAVTGNAFDEDKERAAAAGMAWHIAKPVQFEALRASLAGMRPLPMEEGCAARIPCGHRRTRGRSRRAPAAC